MHVYKIKHNLRKIALNNTTSFSQSSPLTVQLTVSIVERRDEIIHFCRVFIFVVDFSVQWSRAEEERH